MSQIKNNIENIKGTGIRVLLTMLMIFPKSSKILDILFNTLKINT